MVYMFRPSQEVWSFKKQDRRKLAISFEDLYGQVVRDFCHQGLLEGQQIRMTKRSF